ncbi:YciK family oxidoreductase [Reinekea marina]|uniref:YciK family oxidoreductase n=1 Tax=Reinekea marina TaxID=1310421 RepID=A0ABV7WUS2_9GAMM|nr:YciK family oxidoreductase [Reinekea marina]MDN3648999.1 YciK family oxidoreductase [Reinekea marina]
MTQPTQQSIELANKPDSLKGKTLLITGASDGIGKAAALDFARHGANIILLARNQDKLEQVYDQIESETNTQPIIFPYDLNVLSLEVAKEMTYAIEQEFGSLDGILHNASLLGSKMSISQYPENEWNEVINVNLNSAFLLTQAMLPLIEASDSGRIVFTTSSVGRQGRAFWGAYGVSKFATEGLMQTLAAELGNQTNIRTFAINPGGTRTNMRASAYPGEHPESVPAPEAHMPLYRYLFSDHSQEHNGLSIDAADYLSK